MCENQFFFSTSIDGLIIFEFHEYFNEINYFRCAEHAVSPQDDSQASPSQGFMMRKVLLG